MGAILGAATGGHLPEGILAWVGTGFLGAYTTFSTFTYETVHLIEDGAWNYVAWNLALSGPLSFAGAGLAFFLAR